MLHGCECRVIPGKDALLGSLAEAPLGSLQRGDEGLDPGLVFVCQRCANLLQARKVVVDTGSYWELPQSALAERFEHSRLAIAREYEDGRFGAPLRSGSVFVRYRQVLPAKNALDRPECRLSVRLGVPNDRKGLETIKPRIPAKHTNVRTEVSNTAEIPDLNAVLRLDVIEEAREEASRRLALDEEDMRT